MARLEPPLNTRGTLHELPICVETCAYEQFSIADVQRLSETEILIGDDPGRLDTDNGATHVMDPRDSLVFEFARLVLELQPKTFSVAPAGIGRGLIELHLPLFGNESE